MVGARGFEPPTPCAQGRCANQAALRPDIKEKILSTKFEIRNKSLKQQIKNRLFGKLAQVSVKSNYSIVQDGFVMKHSGNREGFSQARVRHGRGG